MNKLSAVLLAFILFISMTMPVFASVPEKNGYIQDSAHIFPEDKLKEINLITHSENFNITFYILTVENLNGKNSAEYAAEAFRAWELKENDVLMLISHKDHRIEVNYKNKNFFSHVNLPLDYDQDGNSRESILEEVIGKHFIPYAKKEDYASGVISFMNTFRLLHTVDEKSNQAGTESKSSNTDEDKKEPSETSTSSSEKLKNSIIIVIVLALVFIPLLYLSHREIGRSSTSTTSRPSSRSNDLPNTNSQRQQPITVADALEDMLNSNNTTNSQPAETNSESNNNSNDTKLESPNINPGYRVIRSTKQVNNSNEKQEKYQNKRVIR